MVFIWAYTPHTTPHFALLGKCISYYLRSMSSVKLPLFELLWLDVAPIPIALQPLLHAPAPLVPVPAPPFQFLHCACALLLHSPPLHVAFSHYAHDCQLPVVQKFLPLGAPLHVLLTLQHLFAHRQVPNLLLPLINVSARPVFKANEILDAILNFK